MSADKPDEAKAREIARAICVEYRLSPEAYERQGGEHPIIHVIVRHIAPALLTERAACDERVRAARREALEECAAKAREYYGYHIDPPSLEHLADWIDRRALQTDDTGTTGEALHGPR